ncbi:uncharacterized protein LOC115620580 isoform X2 [Scaptodrosophila lebanonensis]|uniref:Uncharacterized protein LOC115620580 isoform X2 n=1 Tax=Drosophila lebanonensis TaxID=7225 RepID=A0A6J2T375_DROLE|nr:uncharacterized protein LOC115620580 isoform X2 [Scaptodrosophila lebanonensis]
MDSSRLLNVFQEDAFEGNFNKYESETYFWSNDNVDINMELTDTLNGILPMSPTEDLLMKHNEEELQNSKNILIYNELVEQQLSEHDANEINSPVYQAISDSVTDDAFVDSKRSCIEDDAEENAPSECSNSTFRTRTDSSSIGDYESHSSDYDDDDFDDHMQPPEGFVVHTSAVHKKLKSRTFSTNTISSDTDAFGLNFDANNFDANNFDLAEFITKDDFAMNMCTLRLKDLPISLKPPAAVSEEPISNKAELEVLAVSETLPQPIIVSSKSIDSDDDNDSIIDVETIDIDESLWVQGKASDMSFIDNVKDDPSWCPKQTKKSNGNSNTIKEKTTQTSTIDCNSKTAEASTTRKTTSTVVGATHKPKTSKNICLVPNKKQCDILKRKVGTKTPSTATTLVKSTKAAAKKLQEALKAAATITTQSTNAKANVEARKGVGIGGKNLALIKQQRDSIGAAPNHEICSNEETLPNGQLPVAENTQNTTTIITPDAPKRKLNLEEYKQRRCGGTFATRPFIKSEVLPDKIAKLDTNTSKAATTTPVVLAATKVHPSPHKAAISSIVNSLKNQAPPAETPTDPITVARNKVLRMLEMKRAQQLKILDSRVSAKVPRVTKLPPLKDIVKDTYCMDTKSEEAPQPVVISSSKVHTDYEEIIIVSASCNTDITIPPCHISVALKDNKVPPNSRSLLKSSVLLYNISNSNDGPTNLNNSLIASIQCEVVKKTSGALNMNTTAATPEADPQSTDKNAQHGEDMVIMHLPKDRVRKQQVSMATQTELQPEFPLLVLPTIKRKSRDRTRCVYRKRRNSSTGSEESSSSSTSSSASCRSLESCRSRSHSRSNSIERLRHMDVASATCGNSSSVGGGGYSSRSTHRHRSSVSSSSYSEAGKYERAQRRQRRTSYNKRRSKKHTRSTSSTSGSEYSDRSRSPIRQRRSRSRSNSDTRYGEGGNKSHNNNNRRSFVDRNVSQPAVEERRIVYVGRIEQETTKEMLRRKFVSYGPIKQITIHYKENGMKYGFVTYERAQDAFTAIDTSARNTQINMYDISFGGRRAFCRASYADLDNAGINNYHSYVFPTAVNAPPKQEDSFEALLQKVKAKMNASKPAAAVTTTTPATSPEAMVVSCDAPINATNRNVNSKETEKSCQI